MPLCLKLLTQVKLMSKNIKVNSASYTQNHLRENIYLLSDGKIDDISYQLDLIDKFELDSKNIKWEEIIASVSFGGAIAFGISAYTVENVKNELPISISGMILCLIVGILCIWFSIRTRKKTNNLIPLQTKHIREVISKCKDSLLHSNES